MHDEVSGLDTHLDFVRKTDLSGWGNSHVSSCRIARPSVRAELLSLITARNTCGVITRGCGRSYGDQATNKNGHVIDTKSLTSIESFDERSGLVVCESGVTLNSLIEHCLPHGFVPAVCPGTGFVTVGGAIANDVHGKNHFSGGSFGNHVEWLELVTPAGDLRVVSDESDPDLFRATIGGIGLTGVIARAAIRMESVPSENMSVTDYRIKDLSQFMEQLERFRETSPHTVGWIDTTARGHKLGRGILSCATPIAGAVRSRPRVNLTVPFPFPQFFLNRHSVKLFNGIYISRVRVERKRTRDFRRFVFPLDAVLHWNRLYGRKGVFQFQCVIPFEAAADAVPQLMLAATTSAHSSPLAVLKTLSHEGAGMLSFPRAGYTLALDFPRNVETERLIKRMYDIAIQNGGRAYLAKDACLDATQFRKMYTHAERFLNSLAAIDSNNRMTSDMARRLGLVV